MGCPAALRRLLAACLAAALLPLAAADRSAAAAVAGAAGGSAAAEEASDSKKHHHHHRHRHSKGHHGHRHHHAVHLHQHGQQPTEVPTPAVNSTKAANASEPEKAASKPQKMSKPKKASEADKGSEAEKPGKAEPPSLEKAMLQVNAPLPPNFAELFARGVAKATLCKASEVKVLASKEIEGKLAEIRFAAPESVVEAVLDQAADPDSKLATGPLCPFLVAKTESGDAASQCPGAAEPREEEEKRAAGLSEDDGGDGPVAPRRRAAKAAEAKAREPAQPEEAEAAPADGGVDVDTDMPFGDLEPFGREDTAQELTESAIKESNAMVDQLERAEVAEEKRAVFRALTRLRGAAITSFDGIARSQTGSIDEYNKLHQWRSAHPLNHLASEESDISKWAFPNL